MRITICVATYNGELYIHEQIASIVSQLQAGDEILVADDGSTDATLSIVEGFHDYVKVISCERVGGVVANFERVISAASGNAIVLCDQDDVWLPGRIDLIRHELQSCDLVLLNGQVVDATLKPRGGTIFESVGVRYGFFGNLWKNGFVGCCMAFRAELRDRILPFPKGIPWHDWYVGLVAELLYKVKRIDKVTMLYRRHGSNFSPTGDKSNNSILKKLWMRYRVLRAVALACYR